MSERIYIALYDDDLYPLNRIPVRNAMLTRAEAVERMARAIYKAECPGLSLRRELWRAYIDIAQAALDALLES